MIRAIIFDCFGVVLEDALKARMEALRQTDAAKAAELTDILHANHHGLISAEEATMQLAAGLDFTVLEFRSWIDVGERRNLPLLDYIMQLKQDYKTAMLSNIGKGSIERRFTEDELKQYFDTVVASGEIGYAKPEAEAYEITADQLGVRLDECVFTDDREQYCEAARGVGMQAILYKNFAQFRSDLEALLAYAQK